jgi:hypothetical protein
VFKAKDISIFYQNENTYDAFTNVNTEDENYRNIQIFHIIFIG